MLTYKPCAGATIDEAAIKAIALAKEHMEEEVMIEFNDTIFVVTHDDTPERVVNFYFDVRQRCPDMSLS